MIEKIIFSGQTGAATVALVFTEGDNGSLRLERERWCATCRIRIVP